MRDYREYQICKGYIYSVSEPGAMQYVSHVMIVNETDKCSWRLFYNECNTMGRKVAAAAAFSL
jgi:hypothetical protein